MRTYLCDSKCRFTLIPPLWSMLNIRCNTSLLFSSTLLLIANSTFYLGNVIGKEENTRPKYWTLSNYQNGEQTRRAKVLFTTILLSLWMALDFIWLNSCSVTQIHKICFAGKSVKITKKISPNFNFFKVKKIEGQLKKS